MIKEQMLSVQLRAGRTLIVNELILEISKRGRRFFNHEGKVAEIVDKGKIYYKAEYGKKEFICLSVASYRTPRGWFHGGTLLSLVQEFRSYIKHGVPREYSAILSPHWGYPEEDMIAIQKLAFSLGFLKSKS